MEYRSDFIQIVRLCVLYEALVNIRASVVLHVGVQ